MEKKRAESLLPHRPTTLWSAVFHHTVVTWEWETPIGCVHQVINLVRKKRACLSIPFADSVGLEVCCLKSWDTQIVQIRLLWVLLKLKINPHSRQVVAKLHFAKNLLRFSDFSRLLLGKAHLKPPNYSHQTFLFYFYLFLVLNEWRLWGHK